MKKIINFFGVLILLVLFATFFISIVRSQDLGSAVDQFGDKADQIDNTLEKIDSAINDPLKTREDLRKEYLKKEGVSLLEKNVIAGPIIRGYKVISPYTNPILEYCVGMAPTLSWYFILLFIIWFTLVKYFYTFYEVLRDFSTFSNSTSLVISSAFFVILIVLQFFQNVSKFFADKIIWSIGLFDEWWMQAILVLVGIIIFIFIGILSKYVKVFAAHIQMQKRAQQEELKKMQTDTDRSIIHAFAESIKKLFERK
jgi:predicted Holliday junction resolvase-like endonuclease